MLTVTNTTTDVRRSAFCLTVTNGDGGSLVLEYAAELDLPERTLHREAFTRSLAVIGERGWNPVDCGWAVCRLVVGNGGDRFAWWEAVQYLDYPEVIRYATGMRAYVAPGGMGEEPPHRDDCAESPPVKCGFPMSADEIRKPAERAGRKTLGDDERELLATLFGVVK